MRNLVNILDVDLHRDTTVIWMGFEKGCGMIGKSLLGHESLEIIEI